MLFWSTSCVASSLKKQARKKEKEKKTSLLLDRTNRARVLLNFEKESSVRPRPTHSRPSGIVFGKGSFDFVSPTVSKTKKSYPQPATPVNHLPFFLLFFGGSKSFAFTTRQRFCRTDFKKKKHLLAHQKPIPHFSYPPPTTVSKRPSSRAGHCHLGKVPRSKQIPRHTALWKRMVSGLTTTAVQKHSRQIITGSVQEQ